MAEKVTTHIKLDQDDLISLGRHAQNYDLSVAQLTRRIIKGWLDGQVFVSVESDGPVRAQTVGHRGYDPVENPLTKG